MKRHLLFLSVLAASAFAANATDITVNVSVADAVYAQYYDSSSYSTQTQQLTAGDNELSVPDGGCSVYFYANSGYVITEFTKNGEKQNQYQLNYVNTYVQTSDAGATYAITASAEADAYDATAYITIDDPTKVQIQTAGTYRTISTSNITANQAYPIQYISSFEQALYIRSTSGDELYQVTVNEQSVPISSGQYTVTLSPDAQIKVLTAFPDESVNVTFNLSEGADGFITAVYVNDEAVADFANGFEAKLGSKIKLESSTLSDYKFESISLNGTVATTYFYGTYTFTLTAATEVGISAKKYGTLKGTIVVDNPANVKVYKGYSYNGTLLTLNQGSNEVEVSENNAIITIKAQDDCYLTSVLQGDTEKYSSGDVSITLADGDVITITSGAIERNSSCIIYIDDTSAAVNQFMAVRNDSKRSSLTLTSGYNTVAFDTALENDNLLRIGAYGSPVFVPYFNDAAIELASGITYVDLTVSEGDVAKIFLKEAPTEYAVSFTFDGVEAQYVTVTKDIVTTVANFSDGFNTLTGTQVDITVPDGVSVSANDTKLEANDGKYTTTINAATTIALTATTNGIEEIGVDNNAETIIYNLQGIRINSQIENLPAGFYIVNGKKIIIK